MAPKAMLPAASFLTVVCSGSGPLFVELMVKLKSPPSSYGAVTPFWDASTTLVVMSFSIVVSAGL